MTGHAAVALADALICGHPTPDRVREMMVYGHFVGAWDGSLRYRDDHGEWVTTSAEVHFGWVLAGKAIQDVWVAPARTAPPPRGRPRMFGTTLRVYRPEQESWEITWIDPGTGAFKRMDGRATDAGIVQEYRSEDGAFHQWRFVDITDDSFRWISRFSSDRSHWRTQAEFRLRRRCPAIARPAPGRRLPERAFDFWIGTWIVVDAASGETLGASHVTPILGGRALREHWKGTDGAEGDSLNIYDVRRNVWHQTWMSRDGSLLVLEGSFADGVMDLRGSNEDAVEERIRWTDHLDGTVTQHWESSCDGGRTWTSRFEGRYTRPGEPAAR
jgi:hypothetical protein